MQAMSDTTSKQLISRSWFDRLTQVVTSEPKSVDELVDILRGAHGNGLLSADLLEMLEGVFGVSGMRVSDVMVPRSQMRVVSRQSTLEEILSQVVDSGHSRVPVVGETLDEVLGILLAKDLLAYAVPENKEAFQIREVLRPATFIPESKRLNVLLKDFRSSRNHMAVVVDEYGGVAGLVTIEDVLEQIVGEIDDEHDIEEQSSIVRQSPERFTVKALTTLEEFDDCFGTQLDHSDVDTVGGYLIQALGHVPKRGETHQIPGMTFKVLRSDSRRLHLLRVTLDQPSSGDSKAE